MKTFLGLGALASALTVFVAAVAGWVMNIMTIVNTFDTMATGEAVVRIIGIIIPIIGAVMGYV